jgi:peptidyl-prolyl cis-trans isomerase A (cyclophilin A)
MIAAMRKANLAWLLAAGMGMPSFGCDEPAKDKKATPDAAASTSPASSASEPTPSASASAEPSRPVDATIDPLYGKFTLEDALKDLPGSGKLIAELDTTAGKLTCTLFDDKAPLTVANFVGLARGLRPYKDPTTGKFVKGPAYDGSIFQRVIGKFMIQGGCPKGECVPGGPGYVFADEIWEGATHNKAGQLCMANSGPNTNGAQFFITDGKADFLDKRGHTIFGECKPTALVHKIATTATDNKDKPKTPQVIKKVTIRRAGK